MGRRWEDLCDLRNGLREVRHSEDTVHGISGVTQRAESEVLLTIRTASRRCFHVRNPNLLPKSNIYTKQNLTAVWHHSATNTCSQIPFCEREV